MIDQSYRHFHWTSSLLSALPSLAPFLTGLVVVILFGTSGEGVTPVVFAILSISGVIVATVTKHYSERYRIEEDHLVRRTGFYHTRTTLLPYDRVVSVNTTQTTFQKYLGLVTLQVQAASDSSIELRGVKQEVYQELDSQIQAFHDRRRGTVYRTFSDSKETIRGFADTGEMLHRMSFIDCLKLGLVRNIALAAIFTFLVTVYRHVSDRHHDFLGAFVERVTGVDVANWYTYVDLELAYGYFPWVALRFHHDADWVPLLVFWGLLFVLFVAAVVVCSFILLWFLYSGFRISISGEHLEITTTGAVTTNRKVPLKKVQSTQRIRTLRHRLLNAESASFYTTSSSYSDSRITNRLRDWIVPIGRPQISKQVIARVFQHIDFGEDSWCGVVQNSWRRRFKKHLAIWFPIACMSVLISPVLLIVCSLILPVLAIEAKGFVASLRYRLTSDAILIERGWWVRKSTVVPLRKIQSVHVCQTYFDRGHGVATLGVSTVESVLKTPTSSIPYVNYEEARDISSNIRGYLQENQFDG